MAGRRELLDIVGGYLQPPALPLDVWRDTYATVHMWSQIVGKVALASTPRVNHFWNIAMMVTSRGLATHPLSVRPSHLHGVVRLHRARPGHRLLLTVGRIGCRCDRRRSRISTAGNGAAPKMGLNVRIWTTPVELPELIRFETTWSTRLHDREKIEAFHQALVSMDAGV